MGLAEELVESTSRLEALVPEKTAIGLRSLVDSMNCYYSNLIEGHHTRPIDIQLAMGRDFSSDQKQKDMQLLAEAHIHTAQWAKGVFLLDDLGITPFVIETHRRFCSGLPSSLLVLEDGSEMKPGVIRHAEVQVGRHIPPRHDAIGNFLNRFDSVYSRVLGKAHSGGIEKLEAISASMIAHHRLVWVHPFLDGNGRVARIVLDAMLKKSGMSSIGLWSMSRGFAKSEKDYKYKLDAADEHRMGDLDGRGNLSEQRLAEFCEFSLGVAKDQVNYMAQMFSLEKIEQRCWQYFNVMQDDIRPEAAHLYLQAFQRGEFERGEASRLTGLSERTARDVLSNLVKSGFLISDSPKGKVRAGFPLQALGTLLPNLYPAGDLDLVIPAKINLDNTLKVVNSITTQKVNQFELGKSEKYDSSYQLAERIASSRDGWILAYSNEPRSFEGRVLGIVNFHVVQSLGKTAVIHHIPNLARIPADDEHVKIEYDGVGLASVTSLERTNGLQR